MQSSLEFMLVLAGYLAFLTIVFHVLSGVSAKTSSAVSSEFKELSEFRDCLFLSFASLHGGNAALERKVTRIDSPECPRVRQEGNGVVVNELP
jgi:hypothetical protein